MSNLDLDFCMPKSVYHTSLKNLNFQDENRKPFSLKSSISIIQYL